MPIHPRHSAAAILLLTFAVFAALYLTGCSSGASANRDLADLRSRVAVAQSDAKQITVLGGALDLDNAALRNRTDRINADATLMRRILDALAPKK